MFVCFENQRMCNSNRYVTVYFVNNNINNRKTTLHLLCYILSYSIAIINKTANMCMCVRVKIADFSSSTIPHTNRDCAILMVGELSKPPYSNI